VKQRKLQQILSRWSQRIRCCIGPNRPQLSRIARNQPINVYVKVSCHRDNLPTKNSLPEPDRQV